MDYPVELQRKAEDARDAWERLLVGYQPVALRVAAREGSVTARKAFHDALTAYNKEQGR